MDLSLLIPSFIAGILTFIAPCTLPLVPGYLGFISGATLKNGHDPQEKGHVFTNGVFYVLGFSVVFILLGTLFGLGGAALAQHRIWLSRIGGVFVIIFGLYMMHLLKLPVFDVFNRERRFQLNRALKPGNPVSSFIFGATFAFGWTPCVGPVLGSILLLASASATVVQGGILLAVFSLGLAIPFLIVAASLERSRTYIQKMGKYLNYVSVIGGIFLVFLGILLVTNRFAFWWGYAYQLFDFINYDALIEYL